MSNPLTQYFRVPKLYVKLPSQGQYYPDGFLETSVTGEVAVYPLTAINQILLKTPDAVLNGETLFRIVKDCVPGVKDPSLLVEPDINTLLLAIRIASSGSVMEFSSKCPKCSTEHTFQINLSHILETQEFMDNAATVDFNGELIIHLQPYNFRQRNIQLLNDVEEAQTLKVLNDREDISETTKLAELAKHVSSMASRTFDLVSQSITSITIVKTGDSVTDRQYISEFLQGVSKPQADVILEKIKELNQTGIDTKSQFQCDNCGNEWIQLLDFDPTSFFD